MPAAVRLASAVLCCAASGCLLWRPDHGEADKQLVLAEKEKCLAQPELLARSKLPGEGP